MKAIIKTMVIAGSIFLVCSCEKVTKEAGCDVDGVWLGHWQIDGGSSGTFITPVFQDETDFDGDIYIRFDLPSLENHGVEFSGKLRNSEVRSMIEISGVEINVTGDISEDSLVSGKFTVSLGFSGTYDGWKIPLYPASTTEIFHEYYEMPRFYTLVYVNGNLWLPDNADDRIYVLNTSGDLVRTIEGNFLNDVFTFDGEFLWTYGYSSDYGDYRLMQYDTLGNVHDAIEISSDFVDAIAFDGSDLYYADNYNRQIYRLGSSGSVTGSIPATYNNVSSLFFMDETILYSDYFSEIIYEMDLNGEIFKAYQLPFDLVACMASDGNGSFWCLTEEYVLHDDELTGFDYTIQHFQLN